MACESCCYLTVQNTLNLLDPCVCNLPGGGTLVLSDGTVYIRTVVSASCQASDFTNLGVGLNITFVDNFGGTDNVSPGDTVNFIGQNGVLTTISGNNLNISGNSLFGSGAPSVSGGNTRTLNYVDTSNGNVYFWNPTTLAWVGPFSALTFVNSSTISWSIPGTGLRSASVINNPTGGLRSVATGEEVFKDTVKNGNDNVLSTSATGTYVPPASRQLATATVGTTDESLPYKVVQNQSGTNVVVNHYHSPVAEWYMQYKTALHADAMADVAMTQPNDSPIAYLWTASGGTVITSPTSITPHFQFPSPGEYTITLTVTNEAGFSDSKTKLIKVDRVIDVGGTDEDNDSIFTGLQQAFDWIDSEDPGNSSLYVIKVKSVALDSARIVPNFAKVVFEDLGKLNVGVDFTVAGTYNWVGSHKDNLNIHIFSASGGNLITLSNGVTLTLSNLVIKQFAAGVVINPTNGSTLIINDCFIQSTVSPGVVISSFSAIVVARNSTLISAGSCLSLAASTIEITQNIINNGTGSSIFCTSSSGTIEQNKILTNVSGANNTFGIQVSPPHATSILQIQHNTITAIGTIAGVNNAFGITVANTGARVVITNNTIMAEVAIGTANTNNTSFIVANNYIESLTNLALFNGASFAGPLVSVAFANYPAYGNVLNGVIPGTITFIGATPYPTVTSGNFQV